MRLIYVYRRIVRLILWYDYLYSALSTSLVGVHVVWSVLTHRQGLQSGGRRTRQLKKKARPVYELGKRFSAAATHPWIIASCIDRVCIMEKI
jgi:hypothetical protein